MKTRFSGLDIGFILKELNSGITGYRVNRIYDVDSKTYLIKLQGPESAKATLLMESGTRIHTTGFQWPKNEPPSGFTMKLRKHLNNKRLESIKQLGGDRVIDLQFGTGDVACHLILELYDRGNMVLTDHAYLILNILRPRVAQETKFLARETYPVDQCRPVIGSQKFSAESVKAEILNDSAVGKPLKKVLQSHVDQGPAYLDHLLTLAGLDGGQKMKEIDDAVIETTVKVLNQAQEMTFDRDSPMGVIRQTKHQRTGGGEDFYRYVEFHPIKLAQFEKVDSEAEGSVKEFQSFDAAVDEFFSNLEGQKIEARALQLEQQSMKKLQNVEKDHANRINQLEKDQDADIRKGQLIELNNDLVEKALTVIRTALANQIDWKELEDLVEEASDDPVVSRIKKLNLKVNQMTMVLSNPFEGDGSGLTSSSEEEEEQSSDKGPVAVEIDIGLSAQANARKYFTKKKTAATKVVKTVQSHNQAMKSAEKRAKQAMRDVNTIARIVKQRKVYWFEKFFWFVSSENYLVIAGRDQQQNELVVKRYLGPNDVYVHAEVQGASSVVIKNHQPAGTPIPPKTLHEAGQMALCYSVAWDSKVVISAYWVHADQVSKTAPTGEYLTVGSFMIRGKKNFLPPSQLALGFGFMFKLDEDSVARHANERKVKTLTEEGEVKEAGEEVELSDKLEECEIKVEDEQGEEEEGIESKDESHQEDDTKPESENPPSGGSSVADDGESAEDESNSRCEFPDTELKMVTTGQGRLEFVAPDVNDAPDLSATTPGPISSKASAVVLAEGGGGGGSSVTSGQPGKKSSSEAPPTSGGGGGGKMKRGQKGKMKKMKEKYKDQDDEDKELAMQILQKTSKEDSKKNRKKVERQKAEERKKKNLELNRQRMERNRNAAQNKMAAAAAASAASGNLGDSENEDAEDGGAGKQPGVNVDTEILDSLTGIPMTEDSLLFAVPVVGPYSTMVNYRFKVKVTPGSNKRGKAAKTALNVFLSDKAAMSRDKDLLKSVKDQDIARNLPGKVKVSNLVRK